MDTDLTPDQEAEARRIYDALKHSADADLLGLTEFQVRDAVHRIGARAIETGVGAFTPLPLLRSLRAAPSPPSLPTTALTCHAPPPTPSAGHGRASGGEKRRRKRTARCPPEGADRMKG